MMSQPEKPNENWRQLMASIAERLSTIDLSVNIPDLYAESMRSLMPHDFLKEWAKRHPELTSAQAAFQTPAFQDLLTLSSGWQASGLHEAFQAPEYQNLICQIAESQNAGIQGILTQIGPVLARLHAAAWRDSWAELRKVIAEGLDRTRDALERVELLAALGWTLPMRMSLPEFQALIMQKELTVESVEEWFLDYYSRNDGAEFASLKRAVLDSDHLVFWKPLLEQIFDAFCWSHFAVCIPSLLSVLEGSIAIPWRVTVFHKERCRKEFFEQRVSAAPPNSIHHFQWKSVATFVLTVFEGVDPNQDYSIPKRNLILHGKSDPAKWDRADCLRLFQAIDTILSLSEELDSGDVKDRDSRRN